MPLFAVSNRSLVSNRILPERVVINSTKEMIDVMAIVLLVANNRGLGVPSASKQRCVKGVKIAQSD